MIYESMTNQVCSLKGGGWETHTPRCNASAPFRSLIRSESEAMLNAPFAYRGGTRPDHGVTYERWCEPNRKRGEIVT